MRRRSSTEDARPALPILLNAKEPEKKYGRTQKDDAQRMKGTSPSRGCDWVVANGIKRAKMEFLDFINTYRRGKS